MLRLIVNSLLAVAALSAATAQGLDRKVVILSTAGKDDAVWKKIADPSLPIMTLEGLKKKFPDDEYVWLEDDPGWYFLIDRDHRSLRLHVTRGQVLRAFLEKADDLGLVRWGDLTKEVQSAALELFTTSAWAIEAMGEAADDIKIELEASIWFEAQSEDRAISVQLSPGSTSERVDAVYGELIAHAVPGFDITDEQKAKLIGEGMEDFRKIHGLSVRFIGVNPFATINATRAVLDAFDDYLRDHAKGLNEVYDGLEEKLLAKHIPELGGKVPRQVLGRDQIPDQMWFFYAQQVSHDPAYYGLSGPADAELFLNSVTKVRMRVEYTMGYVATAFTDSKGRYNTRAGHAVLLIRR